MLHNWGDFLQKMLWYSNFCVTRLQIRESSPHFPNKIVPGLVKCAKFKIILKEDAQNILKSVPATPSQLVILPATYLYYLLQLSS